jgi:hypothetical protein
LFGSEIYNKIQILTKPCIPIINPYSAAAHTSVKHYQRHLEENIAIIPAVEAGQFIIFVMARQINPTG